MAISIALGVHRVQVVSDTHVHQACSAIRRPASHCNQGDFATFLGTMVILPQHLTHSFVAARRQSVAGTLRGHRLRPHPEIAVWTPAAGNGPVRAGTVFPGDYRK